MTLFRNTDATGRDTWHPSEKTARDEVRVALLRGGAPFLEIAKPIRIPSGSKKELAAFLSSITAGR